MKARFEDVDLDGSKCWFLPLVHENDSSRFGFLIAVPGFDAARAAALRGAARVLVDQAIAAMSEPPRVDYLEVCELPRSPDDEGFLELADLPDYFTWRRQQSDV